MVTWSFSPHRNLLDRELPSRWVWDHPTATPLSHQDFCVVICWTQDCLCPVTTEKREETPTLWITWNKGKKFLLFVRKKMLCGVACQSSWKSFFAPKVGLESSRGPIQPHLSCAPKKVAGEGQFVTFWDSKKLWEETLCWLFKKMQITVIHLKSPLAEQHTAQTN